MAVKFDGYKAESYLEALLRLEKDDLRAGRAKIRPVNADIRP